MIEEAYELVESVDEGDDKALAEECGDVLLQVVFHACVAEEDNRFDILDVLNSICDKLLRRHPHVFGDRDAPTADEVLRNWEADKKKEKPHRKSILDGVALSLPALMHAYQIQDRASRVGFDWNRIEEVFDKFEEEWREFRHAKSNENHERVEDEFGDLLFALVNLARYLDIDPEQALSRTNKKFKRRFHHIESTMEKNDRSLDEASLEEMDALWEEAKNMESNK